MVGPGAALGLVLSVVPPVPIDAAQVRAHLDATMPGRLSEAGIEGAVVAVSDREGTLVVGGWGLADVAQARPMDGARTLVRIASLSKTFTATVVAQLEAEGRLDVDADVHSYLGGLRWPVARSEPVTIRQLLGHTSGVINHNTGRVGEDDVPAPLREFIAATMPPRVYPPGAGILYSNHGNALAGLAVEQVTGQPFADHVQATVLDPLGMRDTTYRLDDTQWPRLATSYVDDDGERVAQPYLYFGTLPASSVHTTAADMGRYMTLQLGDGTFDGRRVLAEAAMARLTTAEPMIHPDLPGYHFAFFFGETAGHPTRSHGGSAPAFLSKVVLFDAAGVGIFVCQNGFGTSITQDVVEDFARTFLPAAPAREPIAVVDDGRPVRPETLRGTYRTLTGAENPGFTRARTLLFGPRVEVEVDAEGFLAVDGDRYLRTGELSFARDDDDEKGQRHHVVFVADPDGTIAWVHRDATSAVRPPWHARRWLHLLAYALAFLVLLVARYAPLAWRRLPPSWRWRTIPVSLAARITLFAVIVPHLYAAWVDHGQPDYLTPLRFGAPWWLRGLTWVPFVVLPVAVVLTTLDLRRPAHRRLSRLAVATTLAIATVCALDLYWRTEPVGMEQG